MNAAKPPHIIETKTIEGQRLRCTFSQVGGIFTHAIELAGDDARVIVQDSVDSQDETRWPASPPWQELHVHEQADGSPALMLVGRAGSSHWSMSVTVDERDNSLLFDVACRLRESPEFLGGTYRLPDADHSMCITPVAIGESALPVVKESDGQVVIDATDIGQAPATVRWAYRVSPA